jgi:hypothetical protein
VHLPGSEYLLALAAIAMAFVAVVVIVLVLRQIAGGVLTPFHILLVRYTVECGLIATTSALLPVLIGLAELPHSLVFRICSGILAVVNVVYISHYVHRRRRVMTGPLPPRFLIMSIVTIPIEGALLLNSGAIILDGAAWPYAIAVTWILVQAGIVFLRTFDNFLDQPARDPP